MKCHIFIYNFKQYANIVNNIDLRCIVALFNM